MDLHVIKNKLKDRIPQPIDIKGNFAVLIPLVKNKGQWEVIFELRARHMNSQPGEISFPGGGVEGDESYKEAAIRETIEELGVKESNIEVIGELDYLISHANISIHCFLGTISGINVDKLEPNPDEVDHLFTVPLDYFLEIEPKEYFLEMETLRNEEFPYNLIPNGENYDFSKSRRSVLFYEYDDYIIWGYTAKMMRHLIEVIRDLEK